MDKIGLTVKEAAELSGIGINFLRELTHRPDFPAFKIGRRIMIAYEPFKEWLAQQAKYKVGFPEPSRRMRRAG